MLGQPVRCHTAVAPVVAVANQHNDALAGFEPAVDFLGDRLASVLLEFGLTGARGECSRLEVAHLRDRDDVHGSLRGRGNGWLLARRWAHRRPRAWSAIVRAHGVA